MQPQAVLKRDGKEVPFEAGRIERAIARALHAVGCDEAAVARELARVVSEHLGRSNDAPTIGLEDVQDAVVHVLQESGHYEAAIAYARYRDARERLRRERRLQGGSSEAPHIVLVDASQRRRPWERAWLAGLLGETHGLDGKSAEEVVLEAEALLAGAAVNELSLPLLLSLVDAALVRLGRHVAAADAAPLRVARRDARADRDRRHGLEAILVSGRRVQEQLSLSEGLPPAVLRQYCRGRMWVDGLDDPGRGSLFTATVDGSANPWQLIAQAFSLAAEAQSRWRRVRVVLPPCILGHLERGAQGLHAPLRALAGLAEVFLYCDGRTPLLGDWPFKGVPVSIATYNDDFLLLRQLQELGLPMLAGPHLLSGGYRGRVAVELALNAQGLENEHSQMDELAMCLVAAARVRLGHLLHLDAPLYEGAALRFALFGLPHASPSTAYLEQQVAQEGRRFGLELVRGSHLGQEACLHLGRLLDGPALA